MDSGVKGRLVIKEGSLAGTEFALTQGQAIIGRDPLVDVLVTNERVSRRHARIFWHAGDYYLEDLGSSNGTFLNGQPVKAGHCLSDGDQISLGHGVILVFENPAQRFFGKQLVQATIVDQLQATVMEGFSVSPLAAAPAPTPELTVYVSGMTAAAHNLSGEVITIGRADDNQIVIGSQIVSRHHARLERIGDTYKLVVLPDITNPMLFGGHPVDTPLRLYHDDEVVIKSASGGTSVRLVYHTPSKEHRPPEIKREQPKAAQPVRVTGDEHSQTMLDAASSLASLLVPPQLSVTVIGAPTQTHILDKDQIRIGRAEDNDIVVPSQIVSRHHATLHRVFGGYELEIQPDVSNTLVCQGKALTARRKLKHGDVLRIDSSLPGTMVSMVYHSPSEATAERNVSTIHFGERDKLVFGRDPSNDVALNFPSISRFHAQVERIGQRYRITDLHSANGTFVNDERVEGERWLQSQDTIRIGPYRLLLGQDAFTQYEETSGLRVEAVGLNKWVRKNLNILENISLVFQPKEFIVVVGQSGGGKSTLVDAIAGYRPATHGRVYVNGIDVYQNFDAVRNEIGFVPQRDMIHMELTVYQALDYAAKLRMPKDTTKEERHHRILEVLDELDLIHRKDVQISGLSGGQQKRISIGVELLTRPGLFFLDEPTSGLDPGTETTFMHLMRRLADQGRTIIMVTHATKNVMLADKVVFLARGGYMAWFGPPDEALDYFNKFRTEREQRSHPMEFDQIYAILDDASRGSAKEWAQRFQSHTAYQKYILEPLQHRDRPLQAAGTLKSTALAAQRPSARRTRVSSLRQFSILSARNLKILTRDRSSLVLMLLAAPLVGMLDFVLATLLGRSIFNFNGGSSNNSVITLFLVTVYCLLVAGLSQMREIVKEADIYRRERLVNLKIFPYVASKIWVALILAFYHAAVFTLIHYLAFEMPGGWSGIGLFYITILLFVMASMVSGILASALAPAASSAPLIMILLIVPQIVLSGALAPLPESVSAISSMRWGFEGLVGLSGMGSDVAADACWKLPKELRDEMSLEDKIAQGCTCMGVAIYQPGSCDFPGLGKYYRAELDQPEPAKPADLPTRPAEPVVPTAPEAPQDKSDPMAMAQYLTSLQAYQDEVTKIQTDYQNQMALYETQTKVYQAEMIKYQEAFSKWAISRNSAVKAGESVIETVIEKYGWAMVDKSDPVLFKAWLTKVWSAQIIIMLVYAGIILFLMKRKDVI